MVKKKFLSFFTVFLFLISLASPNFSYSTSSLFAYNTKWCPNPSFDGGLNTVIVFDRFFDFEAVYLQNHTFYAKYNNTVYWLNVTSGSNVRITLSNWFDEFGTTFRVDKACVIHLYVGDKGSPSKVNGDLNSLYHVGNKTMTLTFSKASYCGLHWGSGSTVQLNRHNLDMYWSHSWGNYKTAYGFGIVRGGQFEYGFNSRTYAKNGRSDVEQVILTLGENVTLTYSESNHDIVENDPYDYVNVAKEWFPESSRSAWVYYDSDTQYLDVGFNVYFLHESGNESIPEYWFIKYKPRMVNQNCNITVKSTSEGTITNSMPSIFYIGVNQLAFTQPVYIAWNLTYLIIGLGGIGLMIFTPMWALTKIKRGEYASGLGYGIVFFLIAIGLFIVWLWR